MYERLKRAVDCVRKKTDFVPKVALILGSGLGDFVECVDKTLELPYSEIDNFPVSTVGGHKGQFVFGTLSGVPVVVMQGRIHYYEGYSMEDVVLPTRLMKMLGANTLFLTNAAGGINRRFSEGTLMAIRDQIMLAPSPLIGKNIDELGVRFPDMSEVYDKHLMEILHESANETHVTLKEGVYIQVTGPAFETPSEIRAYSILGADAVGMSTACEAVAAKHMGMRVCGVSCITNMAAGITGKPLTHVEVQETADRIKGEFIALIKSAVAKMK